MAYLQMDYYERISNKKRESEKKHLNQNIHIKMSFAKRWSFCAVTSFLRGPLRSSVFHGTTSNNSGHDSADLILTLVLRTATSNLYST